MIVLDIDVTKLDRNRFREGKNGAKYCDLVLIDHASDYGDGFVKQGVSKEEREVRVEMPILGNFKIIGRKSDSQPPRNSPPPQRQGPPQRAQGRPAPQRPEPEQEPY
jgi:hypothetical protein